MDEIIHHHRSNIGVPEEIVRNEPASKGATVNMRGLAC